MSRSNVDAAAWTTAPRLQVSELLGSFGDNELSPECLDGAMAALKPGGVCIPASYTSHLAPLCTPVLHAAVRQMEKPERFELPMVVKLTRHRLAAAPQAVFTFEHPRKCAFTTSLAVRARRAKAPCARQAPYCCWTEAL
jgi:hypothetical protein